MKRPWLIGPQIVAVLGEAAAAIPSRYLLDHLQRCPAPHSP